MTGKKIGDIVHINIPKWLIGYLLALMVAIAGFWLRIELHIIKTDMILEQQQKDLKANAKFHNAVSDCFFELGKNVHSKEESYYVTRSGK